MARCRRQFGRNRIRDLSLGKPILTGHSVSGRAGVGEFRRLAPSYRWSRQDELADWRAGPQCGLSARRTDNQRLAVAKAVNLDRNPRLIKDVIMREIRAARGSGSAVILKIKWRSLPRLR
jgi:hypothetical protein